MWKIYSVPCDSTLNKFYCRMIWDVFESELETEPFIFCVYWDGNLWRNTQHADTLLNDYCCVQGWDTMWSGCSLPVFPKLWLQSTRIYGVIFQKTVVIFTKWHFRGMYCLCFVIAVICVTELSVLSSDDKMIYERGSVKDLLGFGCGLSEVLCQNFPGGTQENLRTAYVLAEIRTEHLQNSSLEYYRCYCCRGSAIFKSLVMSDSVSMNFLPLL
jgi:hypothetical protein